MGEAQRLFIDALRQALQMKPQRFSVDWLINKPLREHFRERYDAAMAVFDALGGDRDGLDAKRIMKLVPDAYLPQPYNCLVEFDEVQHFTRFKQKALELYPLDFAYGFDVAQWLACCRRSWTEAEAKGASGYRARKPEFPFEGGRHAQRAFFDMFRDFLPPLWGLRPTVRVSELEFRTGSASPGQLKKLIESRLQKKE